MPTVDMFLRKIDELLKGLSNVFGLADDILIAGFDDLGRDDNATLDKVLTLKHGCFSFCLYLCM